MTTEPTLRIADRPTAEAALVIAASAAELWPLVTDINLPARFSDEFEGGEWLDGATEAALGARFQGSNKNPRVGAWQVTCTIVECEPERVYGWAVNDVDTPVAWWRFTLDPVDGGTRLTQSVRLGPGPSGLTPAIERMPDREHDIIVRRLDGLRANMQANLDGIAAMFT